MLHKIDKSVLVGVIALSAMGYSFMSARKAQKNPVKILGLNESDSMKFVAGVGILGSVALIFGLVHKKQTV